MRAKSSKLPTIKASEWPADQVERRKVDDLVAYAQNARTHSEEQIGQLARSIEEWGFTVPVLIDENDGIIAGHGRIMAAGELWSPAAGATRRRAPMCWPTTS